MSVTAETAAFADDAPGRDAARERPVDLVHLARYTLGNRSLEREVLELFLTQSSLYLERLREATDDKQWREAAHTIKGSARGIGAWRVVADAEAAEKLQGETLESGRGEAVRALEASIREANDYIRALLAES